MVFTGIAHGSGTFTVQNETQFENAVENAGPGTVITWKNGSYTNIEMEVDVSGTAANPIRICAETPGSVIFNASCRYEASGNYVNTEGLSFSGGSTDGDDIVKISGNHCTVENCLFENMTSFNETERIDYLELGGHFNEVSYCCFGNRVRRGNMITVDLEAPAASGIIPKHKIWNNYFHNYERPTGNVSSTNGFETIRIGTSEHSQLTTEITVEHNYFFRCSGETEIISNKSCGNKLQHNAFIECQGALTLRHGHNNLVDSNFFIGNQVRGSGGVRVINRDQVVINNFMKDLYSEGKTDSAISISAGAGNPDSDPSGWDQVVNAVISNNTIVNVNRSIYVGAQYHSNTQPFLPIQTVISNNIVYSTRRSLVEHAVPITGVSYFGNIGFGNVIGDAPPGGFTLTDPKLTDSGYYNKLIVGSPAINSAVNPSSAVKKDIEGKSRPTLIDVGAEEFSNASIATPLLLPTDVGVSWKRLGALSAGLIEFVKSGSSKVTTEPLPGRSENVEFSLQRVNGSAGAVTIRCFIPSFSEGQPDAGNPQISHQITWANGDVSQKLVTLPVLSDALAEGDESVHVAFEVISGNALPGIRASANLTISDYPFDAWRADMFGENANTPAAADHGDYDNDGISNLMEYALDSNGDKPDSQNLPDIVYDGNNIEVKFEIDPEARNLIYHLQTAETPSGPWSTVAAHLAGQATWISNFNVTYNQSSGDVKLKIEPQMRRSFWRLSARLQHR